jgi:hypothetical protein
MNWRKEGERLKLNNIILHENQRIAKEIYRKLLRKFMDC